jgi:hypothetical protein
LSTLQNQLKSANHLGSIFHYGKECFLNRWQLFAYIGFFLIFIPRLFAVISFSKTSTEIANMIVNGALNEGNLLEKIEGLLNPHLASVIGINILTLILMTIGVLTLAQLSRDYFEQNQSQKLVNLVASSAQLLLRKGPGVIIAFVLVMIPISMFSLLRVIVLCLLVMLPMELVAGHKGGFMSVFRCIFVKYVPDAPATKWPTFSNMMTIGGLTLSSIFLFEMFLTYALNADAYWNLNSTWWVESIKLMNGGVVSRNHLVVHILELLGDTLVFVVSMPFVASLRYHAQKHTFLIST